MTTVNLEKKAVEKVVRKTVTVRVPVDVHAKFKAIAKFSNEPMQKILATFVEKFVEENFDESIHSLDDEGIPEAQE